MYHACNKNITLNHCNNLAYDLVCQVAKHEKALNNFLLTYEAQGKAFNLSWQSLSINTILYAIDHEGGTILLNSNVTTSRYYQRLISQTIKIAFIFILEWEHLSNLHEINTVQPSKLYENDDVYLDMHYDSNVSSVMKVYKFMWHGLHYTVSLGASK